MAKIGVHEMQEFLKDILASRFYLFIDVWIKNSTTRERDGLKAMMQIYRLRGLKPLSKNKDYQMMGFDTIQSKYRLEGTPHYKTSDFCSMLTDKAGTYLKNWLSLETSKTYVSLVMSFLRGFYSITQIKSLKEIDNRTYVRRDLNFKAVKDFSVALQLGSSQQRHLLHLRGTGEQSDCANYIKVDPCSNYQEHFNKQARPFKAGVASDFNTSLIARRLPESHLNYKITRNSA